MRPQSRSCCSSRARRNAGSCDSDPTGSARPGTAEPVPSETTIPHRSRPRPPADGRDGITAACGRWRGRDDRAPPRSSLGAVVDTVSAARDRSVRRHRDRRSDRILRASFHGNPAVPRVCRASRPALPCERLCRGGHGLYGGRRRQEHYVDALLPIRRRGSGPHPRRSSRGLSSPLRRCRRRRMGTASGRRSGLLGRRRIAFPGRYRQPDRPRGTPEREDQAGPADGPSHLVGGLGGAGVVRADRAPRTHLSGPARPPASPVCRGPQV